MKKMMVTRRLLNGARTDANLAKYSTMDALEMREDNLGTILKGMDGCLYYLKTEGLSRKSILKNMREGAALYLNPDGYWSPSEAEAHGGRKGEWLTGNDCRATIQHYADNKPNFPHVYSALFWSYEDSRRVIYLEGYSLESLVEPK